MKFGKVWGLGLLAAITSGTMAQADIFSKSGSADHLAYCSFGPKIRVVASAPAKDGDAQGCAATAKIQGVLWECASADGVTGRVEGFRKKLLPMAARECERFCASRAKGCRGKFQAPLRCGLGTDYEEALAAGKKLGCRPDCGGTAMSYCSLYDAAYRVDEPALIAKQAPNCVCGS